MSTQKTFKQQALSLVQTINDLGNPFLNETEELLTLDKHNVLDASVVSKVHKAETRGKDEYNNHRKLVLVDRTSSMHETIKKNSLRLFRSPTPKIQTTHAEQITILKNDVDIFSRLYIATQHREVDMGTFFKHENHPYPHSLSDKGNTSAGKEV